MDLTLSRKRKVRIDHVTMAASRLDILREAFANVGLETTYGGVHSNNVTHMAILRFSDGSYLELISTLEQMESPIWKKHITNNGGPCGWAAWVDDIAAEVERVRKLGINVRGPTYYSRRRPDGALVEWDLAFLGDGEPGALMPFLIRDRTNRELRVQVSSGSSEDYARRKSLLKLLNGVNLVVLATRDWGKAQELFATLYGWTEWSEQEREDGYLQSGISWSIDTPVAIITHTKSSWLIDRMNLFGDSPCAFLLGTTDIETATKRLGLVSEEKWFGRRLAWFDPLKMKGVRGLGVIEE